MYEPTLLLPRGCSIQMRQIFQCCQRSIDKATGATFAPVAASDEASCRGGRLKMAARGCGRLQRMPLFALPPAPLFLTPAAGCGGAMGDTAPMHKLPTIPVLAEGSAWSRSI